MALSLTRPQVLELDEWHPMHNPT
ncbi:unnamed protein product [Spirodela intermedia]|uniref:Uncharacterized protein n=2 Tax=Spirodela intermedia TaxID=51605 RepID=A0A7I8JIQ3_SPIIN|nr:unnamed protein product [Spirodela intermedia]CAA6669403.1 unnamed protein product [Spirodela intermedia]CAA7406357.1 unnamed protein product [Spirodela intermedia]